MRSGLWDSNWTWTPIISLIISYYTNTIHCHTFWTGYLNLPIILYYCNTGCATLSILFIKIENCGSISLGEDGTWLGTWLDTTSHNLTRLGTCLRLRLNNLGGLDLDQITQVTDVRSTETNRKFPGNVFNKTPVIYPLLIVKWHKIISSFQSISRWLLWLFGGIFHLLITTYSPSRA